MSTNPDERFEEVLREGLRANPDPEPIRNLPERAMALAMSRQDAAARSGESRRRISRRRFLDLATVIAAAAVVCILAVGGWSLLQTASAYASRDAGAVYAVNRSQGDDLGFAALVLALVVILLAAIARAVSDALGTDYRPQLPPAGVAETKLDRGSCP